MRAKLTKMSAISSASKYSRPVDFFWDSAADALLRRGPLDLRGIVNGGKRLYDRGCDRHDVALTAVAPAAEGGIGDDQDHRALGPPHTGPIGACAANIHDERLQGIEPGGAGRDAPQILARPALRDDHRGACVGQQRG